MVDCLCRRAQFVVDPVGMASIGVAIETREVRRRYFDADLMAFLEDIAGDTDFDSVFVDGTGLQEFAFVQTLAVPGSNNAVAKIFGISGRGDVDEFGGPVSVRAVGGGVEHDLDWAGDFEVFQHWLTGITEHVAAHFGRPLVVGPPGHDMRRAAVVATQGLHWIARVVSEVIGFGANGLFKREVAVAD